MIDYNKKTITQLEDLLKDFEVAKEYIEDIIKEKSDKNQFFNRLKK